MAKTKAVISIIMGSDSDLPCMEKGFEILKNFSIEYEVKVLSAHRTPEDVSKFAKQARKKGIKVIIAGAGGAAHLAGVVASFTTLPVIGVPIPSKALSGLDSLLSIVQMPSGIPVATVAIGDAGAKNACILALQILGVENNVMAKRLALYKKKMAIAVRRKNKKLNG